MSGLVKVAYVGNSKVSILQRCAYFRGVFKKGPTVSPNGSLTSL